RPLAGRLGDADLIGRVVGLSQFGPRSTGSRSVVGVSALCRALPRRVERIFDEVRYLSRMASSEELGFSDGCNGLAAIVLLLLHRRGIALAAAQRQSIASCHDIAQIS